MQIAQNRRLFPPIIKHQFLDKFKYVKYYSFTFKISRTPHLKKKDIPQIVQQGMLLVSLEMQVSPKVISID